VLRNEFLRYKNVPGLAVGHPAIIYDNVTDLCGALSTAPRVCRASLCSVQQTMSAVHATGGLQRTMSS
jgi:hypothetical protein